MTNSKSLLKKFETILANQAYEDLSAYTEPRSWEKMSPDEREMLGLIFIKKGEQCLSKGDHKVVECFDLAAKVAPESAQVLFQQALVYSKQGENIRCLNFANKSLEAATNLDPFFANAWHAWGNILVRIGCFYNNATHLQEAHQKFLKVEELRSQGSKQHLESLYWHWGACWYQLGKHSGEAYDFHTALLMMRRAYELGMEQSHFFNDFGNVLVELAGLINRLDFYEEAVIFYKKSIDLESDSSETWLNLACSYHQLYLHNREDETFHQADECFERAISLNSECVITWTRWADLYVYAGKFHHNLAFLHDSFEKYEKALACEPDNPIVLAHWAEAQLNWGSFYEDLLQLREAESKIIQSLASSPHDPSLWYIYANCLFEIGRYFQDEDYFRKAIEKYEHGLSFNQNHSLLLYGNALTHFTLGEMCSDEGLIEKSIHFYAKVNGMGEFLNPQFWNDWGIALMKMGELTQQKKYFEAAVNKFEHFIHSAGDSNIDTLFPEWLYNYGCALDFLGDLSDDVSYYEKAVKILSKVVQLEPDYIFAKYNLALALYHLGEINTDIECMHKSIDLFQDYLSYDGEDGEVWNDFGLTLLSLADIIRDPIYSEESTKLYEQAESKLLHAAALGCEQAFYNLACLYSFTGNYANALHYMERAEQCNVLPSVNEILEDDWLEGLRETPQFRYFLSQLAAKQQEEEQQ